MKCYFCQAELDHYYCHKHKDLMIYHIYKYDDLTEKKVSEEDPVSVIIKIHTRQRLFDISFYLESQTCCISERLTKKDPVTGWTTAYSTELLRFNKTPHITPTNAIDKLNTYLTFS